MIGEVCLQFLSTPKFYNISSMKPSLNRTTIFKLIVHGIELHAAFEERENKLCNVYQHKLILTVFTNKDFYE